jgi:hypothetical protein
MILLKNNKISLQKNDVKNFTLKRNFLIQKLENHFLIAPTNRSIRFFLFLNFKFRSIL